MATLTFVYAESTAVVGPLATVSEPHSWDLCERHAARVTVPRGWEMIRSGTGFARPVRDDDDLTALAEAVREGALGDGVVREVSGGRRVEFTAPRGEERADMPIPPGPSYSRRPSGPVPGPTTGAEGPAHLRADAARRDGRSSTRPGRRGHLRVLPDPVD
ncbi:DUF3499 domain-containing protein [Gordonia jinhuaensis]|uniref:DUF3499 domain-containing protein n=1 Tax=Gordonia jinhuaensis TaxID=1517702 RepID=A0A916SZM0_9ACTN|nr:hypothetical protein GCM10011489_09520 [Gordonia jinhuaensis]